MIAETLTRRRSAVIVGTAETSGDPACELSTVLGSCVAACFYDPIRRIGGMNHFLLGEPADGSTAPVDEHYGLYLMEVLINQMMQAGADRRQLRAHLYGGAQMRDGMGHIGAANARFARRFLEDERIPLVRHDLGGTSARRVVFRPYTGQIRVTSTAAAVPPPPARPRPTEASGDIEFF